MTYLIRSVISGVLIDYSFDSEIRYKDYIDLMKSACASKNISLTYDIIKIREETQLLR
jgi:hypothetical protein